MKKLTLYFIFLLALPTSMLAQFTGGIGRGDDIIVALYVNSPPIVNLGPDTSLCGTSFMLDAQNFGYNYNWSTGETTQTINVTATGDYSVTITDGPCSDRDTIHVTFFPQPSVSLGNNIAICIGDSAILDAKNVGNAYKWSTGVTTQTITVTSAGTYSVTVSNGICSDRDTVIVTFSPQPIVDLGKDDTLCTGNTKTIDAGNPGSNYYWSTTETTQTINVTTSGAYSVTVSTGSCTDRDTINVIFYPQPNVYLGADDTLCTGNTLTLDAGNPGSTYYWSTTATTQTITVTSAGTYSVTVTNGICTDRDTINIIPGIPPVVDLGPDETLCVGDSKPLDAGNAGSIYIWSTGVTTQTISVTTTGSYSVTVNTNGCTERDTINVTFNAVPVVALGPDTTVCGNGPYQIDAGNPGSSYTWSTGESTQTINVSTAGTYSVTVTNSPCTGSDAILVTFAPNPTVSAGADVTIDANGSTQLNATPSGAKAYLWSPSTGLSATDISDPMASPTVTTTYTVKVTDSNGCTGTDQVIVTVKEIDCGDVYVPNAFTPNGDNINDMLQVKGKCIVSMTFIIYDRWGEKVFQSEDKDAGWDGKYKGKNLGAALFTYYLKATMLDNSTFVQRGEINLIR